MLKTMGPARQIKRNPRVEGDKGRVAVPEKGTSGEVEWLSQGLAGGTISKSLAPQLFQVNKSAPPRHASPFHLHINEPPSLGAGATRCTQHRRFVKSFYAAQKWLLCVTNREKAAVLRIFLCAKRPCYPVPDYLFKQQLVCE